ncbi:MAG TPA: transaldolase [Dehalococcoidales bacterium]|nr:transaldolase [Dehalococcoidales bacterium]
MNSIQSLQNLGQSIWLDFISRSLLTGDGLQKLVDQGVTGVTSNPSIFQKAIGESRDYDSVIENILKNEPEIEIPALYEKLAVKDIQMAADILMPVYDITDGRDGFVSLEVSPHLSNKTSATVREARRLWKLVKRPNLMIKVPATAQGLKALETLTAEGINVNATLIFSLEQYEAVAKAYIAGLEKNPDPARVASVASYFVSRIDTAVDKLLEKNGSPGAMELRGKIAVACCKLVYTRMAKIFSGQRFKKQALRGARLQKMVWGSTGTKNPAYSDVLYVEEIIGRDTINTLPTPTLKAFLDHGQARLSLVDDIPLAKRQIAALKKYGIDINAVTDQLMKEGLQAFVTSFDQMLDSLKARYAKN